MPEYTEIEDPREIRRLNSRLTARLRNSLRHTESRIIGWPGGRRRQGVRFLSDVGTNVFYSSTRLSSDTTTVENLFGHGAPGNDAPLNIDVQFNVPVVRFSRTLGGAFLRHLPTNKIVLAHRGITTLGHGRIRRMDLFSKMAATVREADTSRGTREFVLIGELESSTLINDIDEFSQELRESVRAIKAESARTTQKNTLIPAKTSRTLSSKLREYFDEFSGKRHASRRKLSVADCYHGTIIRAIRDAFEGPREVLKSQAIDLVVIRADRIFLFEAKTSSTPQSIYTAIGQLTAHSPAVAGYAPRKSLVRVMVVPDQPSQPLCGLLEKQLGIHLLTFARSEKGRITISGLEQLN